MSRSYKKTPIIKFGGEGKKAKRRANKRVRKNPIEFKEKSQKYKLLFESWEIQDFNIYMQKPHIDEDNIVEHWKKNFFRK